MRWLIAVIGVALALFLAQGTSAQVEQPTPPPVADAEATPGELLVQFEDDVSEARIEEINGRLGVRVLARMDAGKLLQIAVPEGSLVSDLMAIYLATPGVRYAEPNYVQRIQPDGATDGPSVDTDIQIQ
jgi:hypothetical protein